MTDLALWTWWLTLLSAAVAPPLVLVYRYGARLRWLAFGIASYVLAMVLKVLLQFGAESAGLAALPAWAQAATTGLISAVTELALLLPFVLPALVAGRHVGWPNVLAFGVAIGIFEMLWLLPAGLAQVVGETGTFPTLRFFTEALGWGFLLERLVTILGHAASRGLLYAGLRYRSASAALLSVALFALNDGAASYPDAAGWAWTDVLRFTMFGFFAALALVELACVLLMERWNQSGTAAGPDTRDEFRPPTPPDGPPDRGVALRTVSPVVAA